MKSLAVGGFLNMPEISNVTGIYASRQTD